MRRKSSKRKRTTRKAIPRMTAIPARNVAGVAEVAVFAVKDAYYGEIPAAALRLRHAVPSAELAAFCAAPFSMVMKLAIRPSAFA